jgi:hypothetical protein
MTTPLRFLTPVELSKAQKAAIARIQRQREEMLAMREQASAIQAVVEERRQTQTMQEPPPTLVPQFTHTERLTATTRLPTDEELQAIRRMRDLDVTRLWV